MIDSEESRRVAVIGAGSWGTALAVHCRRRGHETWLWTRTTAHRDAMASDGYNARYLPVARPFPDGLGVTHDLAQALVDVDLVIVAVPSHGLRAVMQQVAEVLAAHPETRPMFLIAAKGVEVDTLKPMAEVLREVLPPVHHEKIAALGGPSFAAELATGLPTLVVVASRDAVIDATGESGTAVAIQQILSGANLRVYVSDDELGVELGGAFKNVIALAAGVYDGAGLGMNARAAIITRGLAEITRLSLKLGAREPTLAGLAGVGDLVLTCTGGLSRNRRVGLALGEGRKLEAILEEMGMVAEGVKNTQSARGLARAVGVDMPITEMMYALLYKGVSVGDAVRTLMQRELKPERDWASE
ncbi:MAG: NAD(P)-dependent glycerol-3-phosphate dehydrogenase [Myxococcales bacterium]|nr:NAD(P)-dependent glycerol-3-phosphate dehydrogenase [Myxococcales bacterium]